MAYSGSVRNVVAVIGIGGMGVAAARRLASGRRLLLADYSKPNLEKAQESLRNDGHDVETHIVDVSDFDSVKEFAQVAAKAGRIDAIVHTAGVSPVMASARKIYEVDLLGTANVIDSFLDVASPGTSLVCIASMAGHFVPLSPDLERHLATAPRDQLLNHKELDLDNQSSEHAYTVSKRGNQLRVQAAARAWGGKGARVNTVSPGLISTVMGRQEQQGPSATHIQAMVSLSATGRIGTPDDIANAVAFLAGSESCFITGTDILVDGGVVCTQRWNVVRDGSSGNAAEQK